MWSEAEVKALVEFVLFHSYNRWPHKLNEFRDKAGAFVKNRAKSFQYDEKQQSGVSKEKKPSLHRPGMLGSLLILMRVEENSGWTSVLSRKN